MNKYDVSYDFFRILSFAQIAAVTELGLTNNTKLNEEIEAS